MDLETIPPITGIWASLALATALLEHTHVVNQFQLFYTPHLVFGKLQLWRVITTFTYFGSLGLDFVFHLFYLMRYSRMLEENSFQRRSDYLWLLLFSSSLLLLISPLFTQTFLGSPLAFVLVYVWSRRNRHVRMSLFGVLTITAPYLPWSLVAFGWILNGSPKAVVGDIMGVAVGHVYYFLVDVWPRELKSGGRNLLATPRFFQKLVDGR
ncbi:Der1-like protein [Violaceomyces palustris]|uniref:Der1-like protein n=1 Tax=Violaceomyces palustris TaxID=1673888 RepID=A0ACD0P4N2_9BASI|nr:Der1-like protein [Violaceomyces palustris]